MANGEIGGSCAFSLFGAPYTPLVFNHTDGTGTGMFELLACPAGKKLYLHSISFKTQDGNGLQFALQPGPISVANETDPGGHVWDILGDTNKSLYCQEPALGMWVLGTLYYKVI